VLRPNLLRVALQTLLPLCAALTLSGCPSPADNIAEVDAGTPGSDTPATPDAGTPADMPGPTTDTGNPPIDTGTAPVDTGNPPVDTGNPPVDTGNPPRDTGNTPLDTGNPPIDTGNPPIDTGNPPIDTGTLPRDTGPLPVDNGPPPVDNGPPPPVDAGPSRCETLPSDLTTALPAFSPAVIARVQSLRALGASRGNRLDVMAKVGDSITEAGGFLTDIGMGWFDLGPYACLEPTVAFFRRTAVTGAPNCLARASSCAMGGWLSDNALQGDPNSPLRAELNAMRPAYAVIMYGTNDLDRSTADALASNLTRIATICEEFGTVPILSTIPDRLDLATPAARVPAYNERIRGVATARNLPLIDYWAAMRPLPRNGIEEDGIHPSIFRLAGSAEAGYLTDAATRFGYNMRNLTTLLMLHRLRALPQP